MLSIAASKSLNSAIPGIQNIPHLDLLIALAADSIYDSSVSSAIPLPFFDAPSPNPWPTSISSKPKFCNALVNNCVDKYPIKIKPDKKPHYKIAVGIIWNKGKILISTRREGGLLGGLWEFPGGKIEEGESAENCIIREIKEELGVSVKPTTFLKQIKHAYTHFSITMDAYHCDYLQGTPQAIGCDNWKWIAPEEIRLLPFPKANHKLFDKIIAEEGVC